MRDFNLLRTGLPSLKFAGELLASVETNQRQGPPGLSWEINLYRTKGGTFVASITRYTQWDGQDDYFEANAFVQQDDLEMILRPHNPFTRIELSENHPMANRMVTDARNAFDGLVTRLYSELGPDFAEVVD